MLYFMILEKTDRNVDLSYFTLPGLCYARPFDGIKPGYRSEHSFHTR